MSARNFEELCLLIGFLDRFISMPRIGVIGPDQNSASKLVVDTINLLAEGENPISQHLGGVPSRTDYDYRSIVKVKACRAKGYLPAIVQDFHVPLNCSSAARKSVEKSLRAILQCSSHCPEVPYVKDKNMSSSKRGVLKYTFGPFHCYVVFRDATESSTKLRYRVYIPSLSLLPNSIGGYMTWTPSHLCKDSIQNLAWAGGIVRTYMRRQWYANLTNFCLSLIGMVPLSHNTRVELSYKIAKHHTDIELLAKQLSGINIT